MGLVHTSYNTYSFDVSVSVWKSALVPSLRGSPTSSSSSLDKDASIWVIITVGWWRTKKKGDDDDDDDAARIDITDYRQPRRENESLGYA